MFKYIFTLVFTVGVLFSCSSSRQGKIIQGQDGKIVKASIIAKCSPPAKAYAKDLTAKVKAEVDSLRYVPQMQFDAAFEQKVVKLRDYSSQGVDLELVLFHICEMANNRGFTSEQTSALIERAMGLYNNTKPLAINQNVTTYNQQGGITTGILVVPQDKEIPLNENYVLQETIVDGKNALKITTRQGTWINPFFGYPANEDSLVKGHFSSLMGIQMGGTGIFDIKGQQEKYKVENIQFTCTPDVPVYFFYQSKPSKILFGDMANPQKQYLLAVRQ